MDTIAYGDAPPLALGRLDFMLMHGVIDSVRAAINREHRLPVVVQVDADDNALNVPVWNANVLAELYVGSDVFHCLASNPVVRR